MIIGSVILGQRYTLFRKQPRIMGEKWYMQRKKLPNRRHISNHPRLQAIETGDECGCENEENLTNSLVNYKKKTNNLDISEFALNFAANLHSNGF